MWADGSPAAVEHASLPSLPAAQFLDIVSIANMRLTAAEEFLSEAASVVADETLIWSLYPPVRSAAEFSALVAWSLEPGIGGTQRAQRVIGDRLHSIKEQQEMPMAGVKEQAKERRREVMSTAARAGLTPEKPPSKTRLMDQVYGGEDKVGAATYKLMSAFSHGTLYSLTHLVQPVLDERGERIPAHVEGMYLSALSTTAGAEASALQSAMIPYMVASTRFMLWTGHDSEDWRNYVGTCATALREVLPPLGAT